MSCLIFVLLFASEIEKPFFLNVSNHVLYHALTQEADLPGEVFFFDCWYHV